eukprot:XP_027320475.1 uncharacterized protein LOC106018694 isoform X2 [Anas platyrhynchos]
MLDLPPECSAGGQGAEGDVGHPWLHLQHPGGLSPNPAQGCCVSRTLRSFAFRIPSGGSAGAKQALDSQPPVGEAAGRSQAPDTRRQRSNGARLATSSPVPGDRGVSCAHPSSISQHHHTEGDSGTGNPAVCAPLLCAAPLRTNPAGTSQGLILRTAPSSGARKCGGAVPPACAGEAGSRALAAIPTPGACGWASPPKPASNSLRGEQRFVCKCMRLK